MTPEDEGDEIESEDCARTACTNSSAADPEDQPEVEPAEPECGDEKQDDIRDKLRERRELIKRQNPTPPSKPLNFAAYGFLDIYQDLIKGFQPLIEQLRSPAVADFFVEQGKIYQGFGKQMNQMLTPGLMDLLQVRNQMLQPYLQISEQHRQLLKSISETTALTDSFKGFSNSAIFPSLQGLSDLSKETALIQNLRELIQSSQFRDLSPFRLPELLDWDLGPPQEGTVIPPEFLDSGFELLEDALDAILRTGPSILGEDSAVRLSVIALYFRQSNWRTRMNDLGFAFGIAITGPANLYALQAFIDQPSIMTFLLLCMSLWSSTKIQYPGELPPPSSDDSEPED